MTAIVWFIVIVVAIFVLSGIKVINQYERGVVLTLGRFSGIRNPGLRIVSQSFSVLFGLIFVVHRSMSLSKRLLRKIM